MRKKVKIVSLAILTLAVLLPARGLLSQDSVTLVTVVGSPSVTTAVNIVGSIDRNVADGASILDVWSMLLVGTGLIGISIAIRKTV